MSRTPNSSPEVPAGTPLAGQTALITGASRGIGLSIARRVARLGAAVGLCGRDRRPLDAAADLLRRTGVRVHAETADVSRASDVASLVAHTEAALGPIDILVNNAGIGIFGPAHERSEADWDAVLDTNLKGAFLVSRAVVSSMIRRHTGHIVNISSLAGKNVFAGGGIYCASKWGLQGLSGCMAEDLRAYGIRVSLVCPGSVATDSSPHVGRDPGKLLQPDDVGHAVAMLLTQSPTSFISEVQLRPVQKP